MEARAKAPANQPADEPVRVFVGTDRSQILAVDVLAYSIRRHTSLRVDVIPMLDLDLPEPMDIRQGKRTGFSFSRFAIPKLAGYRGRALYMDADMIVSRDIRSLWSLPFDGARVLIQEDLPEAPRPEAKPGAPKQRMKQTAVMLLDCGRLDWDPIEIIAGLDGRYTYEELVYHLCILPAADVRSTIPFRWNSLETWDESTCLLHYTDMLTQPWVSLDNPHGWLWIEEVRRMLDEGVLTRERILQEIRLGYFRPSLLPEIESGADLRKPDPERVAALRKIDQEQRFVMHQEVYAAKARRKKAIADYTQRIAEQAAAQPAPKEPAPRESAGGEPRGGRLRQLWRRALGRTEPA